MLKIFNFIFPKVCKNWLEIFIPSIWLGNTWRDVGRGVLRGVSHAASQRGVRAPASQFFWSDTNIDARSVCGSCPSCLLLLLRLFSVFTNKPICCSFIILGDICNKTAFSEHDVGTAANKWVSEWEREREREREEWMRQWPQWQQVVEWSSLEMASASVLFCKSTVSLCLSLSVSPVTRGSQTRRPCQTHVAVSVPASRDRRMMCVVLRIQFCREVSLAWD